MRLLILYPRYWWNSKLPPSETFVVEALQQSTDVTVKLSGVGWDDYDDKAPVQSNIARILPNADAVLWYVPCGCGAEFPPLIEPKAARPVKVMLANDYEPAVVDCIHNTGTQLVLYHYSNSAPGYRLSGAEIAHIPHAANPEYFTGANVVRDVPVLLTGIAGSDDYPLRNIFTSLIRAGRIPGAVIRNHPGYRLKERSALLDEFRDYGAWLQRAQITLIDSSRFKYALYKYVEAAMAGCLIIGDIPDERQQEFAGYVHTLPSNPTEDDVLDAVKYWQTHTAEREARAAVGRAVVLNQYKPKHSAIRIIAAIKMYFARHGLKLNG